MRIYFYHTQDIQRILTEYGQGVFPGHFLYGATHLGDYGIDVIWHRFIGYKRWKRMLVTTFRVLMLGRKIDAIFATHYTGIEPLIFLRALGLYHKPIIVWHHQPVIIPRSKMRAWGGKIFYRGIDEMFFFSQKLIDDSLKTGRVNPEHVHLGHWGADLDFYDRIIAAQSGQRHGFISTGKEMRDMPTLVSAFNQTSAPLDIYVSHIAGDIDYEQVFAPLVTEENVKVHFMDGLKPYELSLLVNQASCVVICCKETKYTVGLTTVVEALAFGLPILCSRNPQIPIDFEREGCGISIPYYDEKAWITAARYIQEHPDEAREMGQRGRKLAEEVFNNRRCASEVAEVILKTVEKQKRKK